MTTLSGLVSTYAATGPAGNINLGTTTSVSPTTSPSVTNTGNSQYATFVFSLPIAANVTAGSVTLGAEGSAASVTNSGTSGNVILDFTIPRGNTGASGGITTGKAIAMAMVFG